MASSLPCDNFLEASGPIVDVRSPREFAQGHVPGARNLPLFDDEGRAAVGTCYKQRGRRAAVRLGLDLVGPQLGRLADQALALRAGESGLRLYCWRGGMRSASMAWLLETCDLPCSLLEGGYKSFRRWLRQSLSQPRPIVLLGGRTGSAKTEILNALRDAGGCSLDLEHLARHRGSSFGGLGLPDQPSTEQFENDIAMALYRLPPQRLLWIEAESVQVGRCRIPPELFQHMRNAPLVVLQRPDHERLDHLLAIYGTRPAAELREATLRIAKRLGPQRTAAALDAIACGNLREACSIILNYYDRTYAHELQRHSRSPVTLESTGESNATIARRLLQLEPVLDRLVKAAPLR